MTVKVAINGLNAVMKTITGLKVYDNPPESINQFPSSITYIRDGEMTDTASGGFSLHTLIAEIYIARQMLPQAVDDAKEWPDLVFAAVKANITWNNTISHVVQPMRYRAGPMRYGGAEAIMYGLQFTIQIKVNEG